MFDKPNNWTTSVKQACKIGPPYILLVWPIFFSVTIRKNIVHDDPSHEGRCVCVTGLVVFPFLDFPQVIDIIIIGQQTVSISRKS